MPNREITKPNIGTNSLDLLQKCKLMYRYATEKGFEIPNKTVQLLDYFNGSSSGSEKGFDEADILELYKALLEAVSPANPISLEYIYRNRIDYHSGKESKEQSENSDRPQSGNGPIYKQKKKFWNLIPHQLPDISIQLMAVTIISLLLTVILLTIVPEPAKESSSNQALQTSSSTIKIDGLSKVRLSTLDSFSLSSISSIAMLGSKKFTLNEDSTKVLIKEVTLKKSNQDDENDSLSKNNTNLVYAPIRLYSKKGNSELELNKEKPFAINTNPSIRISSDTTIYLLLDANKKDSANKKILPLAYKVTPTDTLKDIHWTDKLLELLLYLTAASLGAAFYSLYKTNEYIKKRTFDQIYINTYWTRYLVGIVGGVILAAIVPVKDFMTGEDSSLANYVSAFTPTLLALIGGFSGEVVWNILVRINEILQSLIGSKGLDKEKIKEQAKNVAEIKFN